MKNYLTQPINFAGLTKGEEQSTCGLHQSIAQRIHLLLVTNLGEFRVDPTFGCIIWEHDFENMSNLNLWKDKMMRSVKEGLEKFEKRLFNCQVNIELSQQEFDGGEALRRIKRRVDIKVNAKIKKTNEAFLFEETLLISPVWLD
ncbi:MAG: GPW/gp25 family protein [Bacteroidetes bacterium]|nr:GPW/gp25 family protein [Bacteroidota bacterium]